MLGRTCNRERKMYSVRELKREEGKDLEGLE